MHFTSKHSDRFACRLFLHHLQNLFVVKEGKKPNFHWTFENHLFQNNPLFFEEKHN